MNQTSPSRPDVDLQISQQRARIEDYAIIDTPREAQFDRLVFTAAQFFRVPIAVISLVNDDCVWFKAQVGLGIRDLPRHLNFCDRLQLSDAVITVEDASRDDRFTDNPLVTGPPFLKFYAGAPLITPDGVRVGSFCVGDKFAKTLSSRQSWQLSQFAASVVSLLEARRNRA